jgi:hypothetical protein
MEKSNNQIKTNHQHFSEISTHPPRDKSLGAHLKQKLHIKR